MFPTSNFPYDTYGAPMYSYGGQSDYLQALAEEEAARRQYAEATRAQEEARSRAARARLARQAYESAHSSYLSDEDDADDMLGGFARPGDGFGYPSRRQSAYGYPSIFDRQRAAALERERERERETLRLVEEERERRRRQLMELEEERRRRRLLEEEERRRFQLQREAEERERRRLEEDLLRRQQQSRESMFPLEDLFGLRLPRTAQSQDTPFSRRSRTMSPGKCARPMPPAASPSPVERTASRSPPRQQVPIHTPGSPAARPVPAQREQPNKPQSRQPPTEQEIDAATKIQSIWRRHRALRTIAEHAAKFAQLQKAFTLPSTLEYTAPGSSIHSHHHISVPVPSELSSLAEDGNEGQVPRLAYTPTNAPVHMYDEELARILTALDGIQSGGDDLVRKRRREVVRSVEREAERVEKVKAVTWRAWERQKAFAETAGAQQNKDTAMSEDPSQQASPCDSSLSSSNMAAEPSRHDSLVVPPTADHAVDASMDTDEDTESDASASTSNAQLPATIAELQPPAGETKLEKEALGTLDAHESRISEESEWDMF